MVRMLAGWTLPTGRSGSWIFAAELFTSYGLVLMCRLCATSGGVVRQGCTVSFLAYSSLAILHYIPASAPSMHVPTILQKQCLCEHLTVQAVGKRVIFFPTQFEKNSQVQGYAFGLCPPTLLVRKCMWPVVLLTFLLATWYRFFLTCAFGTFVALCHYFFPLRNVCALQDCLQRLPSWKPFALQNSCRKV